MGKSIVGPNCDIKKSKKDSFFNKEGHFLQEDGK
jgi:hypothetical protein